jgi:hypothetical protein
MGKGQEVYRRYWEISLGLPRPIMVMLEGIGSVK